MLCVLTAHSDLLLSFILLHGYITLCLPTELLPDTGYFFLLVVIINKSCSE